MLVAGSLRLLLAVLCTPGAMAACRPGTMTSLPCSTPLAMGYDLQHELAMFHSGCNLSLGRCLPYTQTGSQRPEQICPI